MGLRMRVAHGIYGDLRSLALILKPLVVSLSNPPEADP